MELICSEWRGGAAWREELYLQLDNTAPVGFIFLQGKTGTLRLASDNPLCLTSLLSNTVAYVFLFGALGNLFQQPFPV